MSTTSIRLEEDLKARVTAAAERAGTTTHAFILEVIERTVEDVEQEEEFHRIADDRWASLLQTGKTVPWEAAKTYAEARARGGRPRKPSAHKPKPE